MCGERFRHSHPFLFVVGSRVFSATPKGFFYSPGRTNELDIIKIYRRAPAKKKQPRNLIPNKDATTSNKGWSVYPAVFTPMVTVNTVRWRRSRDGIIHICIEYTSIPAKGSGDYVLSVPAPLKQVRGIPKKPGQYRKRSAAARKK